MDRLEGRLGKEIAYDYMKAVIEFGLYGVVPGDEEDVWLYGLEQTFATIDSAKSRYEKACANGKKGGRPTVSLDEQTVMERYKELKTWKATAASFGVDEDTLRKLRKQWEGKTEKPKNLNDNENDNDNVNDVSAAVAAESVGAPQAAPGFKF
jgi:hypothetical protein